MLGNTVKRLAQRGIMLEYEDSVPVLLAREGIDSMSGARNLRRVIIQKVEDPLSDMLLSGQFFGKRLLLKTDMDEIRIAVQEDLVIA